MEQRGRDSLENLTVITTLPGQRPQPPDTMIRPEADIWRAVVATKPADWFDAGSLPLLADYCTACVQQEKVRLALNTECKTTEELDRLSKTLDRLAKLKTTLATKMRLSQQSRYRADAADVAAKRGGSTPTKPWERATG